MKSDELQKSIQRFREVLAEATPSDLEFIEEAVTSHPELGDVKVGFTPKMIRSVDIPSEARVMYVRGEENHEVYWYVVLTNAT